MKILKFGGFSISTHENISKVIDIIVTSRDKHGDIAVVVSAFQKVTDELIQLAQRSSHAEWSYTQLFHLFKKRHLDIVKRLLTGDHEKKLLSVLTITLDELEEILHGIYLIKELTPRTLDMVMSFGERLAAFIITELLKQKGVDVEYLDARPLVKTDDTFGGARVYLNQTYANIRSYCAEHHSLHIITGFIGSTLEDGTTTLGRGGSDYTASLFGAALDAQEIEIWIDVDGVMTADPRLVPDAFSISSLSYDEALEISHFREKVVYPPAIYPVRQKHIPIRVMNIFNPGFAGTVIESDPADNSEYLIKGISSIADIALLRVQGSDMIGVPRISLRLFHALSHNKINLIFISQASSEHSVCFGIDPFEIEEAKTALENEFLHEMELGQIDPIVIEKDLSIIAIVGENMRKRVGVAGRLFQSLGRTNVNVVAIAQGSSELNISVVIAKEDLSKAVNSVHDVFFLYHRTPLHIFLIGTGVVGAALLYQIAEQKDILKEKYGLDIQVVGIARHQKMLFDLNGIHLDKWDYLLEKSLEATDLDKFVARMQRLHLSDRIFVDCTASDEIVAKYPEILEAGISIVTPNKKANSANLDFYRKLRGGTDVFSETRRYYVPSKIPPAELRSLERGCFLYETNVGGGLPVISTLGELLLSGDEVVCIQGVLSGTLSYIFNSLDGTKRFSELVSEAYEKGYTESDPREDLYGTDVARKLLILARECGFPLELKDIKVESLISKDTKTYSSPEEFFVTLSKLDNYFEQKHRESAQRGNVLRYIAVLEKSQPDSFSVIPRLRDFLFSRNKNEVQARVFLQEVGPTHPFYVLSDAENIISFTTRRYRNTPLVIKGPGAGGEVSAAGVFADILKIAGGIFSPSHIAPSFERTHHSVAESTLNSVEEKKEGYPLESVMEDLHNLP